MFSQLLTTNHEHEDILLDSTCDPEAEAGSQRCCPSTNIQKLRGSDTTLSKTHDMPKTREQPSPGPSPSTVTSVPVASSMVWAAQLHAVM